MQDEISKMCHRIVTATIAMFTAHDEYAKSPKNRVRVGSGAPYGVHPMLAGALMLHEASIPLPQRLTYFEALTFHDVLEDTTADSRIVPAGVLKLVEGLTFSDDVDSAAEAIKRGPEIAMLKSYDTVGNLIGLDRVDWSAGEKNERINKAERLFGFAKPHYPDLSIWIMAEALTKAIRKRCS